MKVTATIKGESDIPPFVKIFDYDEDTFFASTKVIEEKIQRNLKINTNEALTTYCAYAIRAIHAGRKDNEIQKGASKILSENSVMVGVPQTLRIITFEVAIKNETRKITIREPIPTSNYIMAGH